MDRNEQVTSQDTSAVSRRPRVTRFFQTASVALGVVISTAALLTDEGMAQTNVTNPVTQNVPPPRTINDITAILDQIQPDPDKVTKLRNAAGRRKPRSLKGFEAADFFYRRGVAALKLSLLDQALSDAQKAVDLSRKHGGRTIGKLFLLREVERRTGRLNQSLITSRQLLYSARVSRKSVFGAWNTYVRALIKTGQTEEARKESIQLRQAFEKWAATKSPSKSKTGEWAIFDAEARIFRISGEWQNAIEALRNSIKANEEKVRQAGSKLSVRLAEERIIRMQRDIADAMRNDGQFAEAETLARQVLLKQLSRQGKYSTPTAVAINTLQKIISDQGRFSESETLSRANEDILSRIGVPDDTVAMVVARLETAKALAATRQWQGAADIVGRIEKDLASNRSVYDQTLGKSLIGRVLVPYRMGKPEVGLAAANSIFQDRGAKFGEDHYLTAEARGFRAIGLVESGQDTAALDDFRAAVPILISRSRQDDASDGSVSLPELRRREILSSYITVLERQANATGNNSQGFDMAAEAFRIADAARGRSVQRAVTASSTRAAARSPELANLVRLEQDTQRHIAALFGVLTEQLSVSADQSDAAAISKLREDIDQLRDERTKFLTQLESQFPDFVRLIDPQPARIEEVRDILSEDEALLATFVDEEKTYIWTITKRGRIKFVSVALGRERLLGITTQLRRALDPSAVTLGDIPDFDVKLAHRLFATLLGPTFNSWSNKKKLIVVADGPLGQLPFSLLPTRETNLAEDKQVLFANYKEVPWLARTHAITVMPSVASLVALRALPETIVAQRPFVGFGDPIFSDQQLAHTPIPQSTAIASRGLLRTRGLPVTLRSIPRTRGIDSADFAQLPGLPDTAEEIRTIATALNADLTRDVFLGRAANETSVDRASLASYRVVAFATHGLVPGDLNGLTEPALALTAPHIADGNGDGLLSMGDIFNLRLNADWVVLSACNTGTASGAGAEAVSGLGRAFFYAGTKALLVSNWPVETISARLLTTDVFARQAANRALSKAEALQQARLALIDGRGFVDERTQETEYSYAHPIFWAPFTLIGDGGTSS